MEKIASIIKAVDGWVWGPVLLVLLAGTGIYLSVRMGFPQFRRFGFAMKNTIGKMFSKQTAGKGEVTPFQAVTTALAATVGTGNIAGVTGAIVAGGPGAVFWMWLCALFGMCTKYSEVLLAVKYRERNDKGDWVGGPMYYIKNGLGKNWTWLGVLFCLFGAIAAFGIGNMTQVNSIAGAINGAIDAFGGNAAANTVVLFGEAVPVTSLIFGIVVAVIVGLVLFGGIKRIGSVTERLVPVMAVIYIIFSLIVIFANVKFIPQTFAMIFKGAFNAEAALGGAFGIMIMDTIQKGVGRGVFSNEAGMGSAPMAHAATSENEPVKQGLYGIFEVFMDTIVICTMTSLVLLTSYCRMGDGLAITWGGDGDATLIQAAMGSIVGGKLGALVVAVGLSLFALSTIISWSLYGSRCFEYLCGKKLGTRLSVFYKMIFLVLLPVGATLKIGVVWDLADALNGMMAFPNLVALLALSGVIIRTTKEYFSDGHKLK